MKLGATPRTNLHDWASLRPQLLFAFDQPVSAANINGKWKRRDEFSAWLVRKGWVKVRVGEESCTCEPGQWLMLQAREIEQEFSEDAHLLSLRVAQVWPDGAALFPGGIRRLSAREYPRLEALAKPLLRYMEEAIPWNDLVEDPRRFFLWKSRISYFDYINYERQLLAWLKELAGVLIREGARMHVPENIDVRMAGVIQAMDLIPVGRPFPKNLILREGGLSLDRLNQLSLEAYGHTLHKYWENRRLDWACRMLESPNIRIKEVSLELGFRELSHFSAWFKRLAGLSPRKWRTGLSPATEPNRYWE